jgi:hypothetical protein
LKLASYLLYLSCDRECIGPEPEVIVPLRKGEGLEGRAILLLNLPILEG